MKIFFTLNIVVFNLKKFNLENLLESSKKSAETPGLILCFLFSAFCLFSGSIVKLCLRPDQKKLPPNLLSRYPGFISIEMTRRGFGVFGLLRSSAALECPLSRSNSLVCTRF